MGRTWRATRHYCGRCHKYAHVSHKVACEQRRSLIESGKHTAKSGHLAVYRCPHGNGWHIGHVS